MAVVMGEEMRKAFSERLKELCDDYYETYCDEPPVSTSTVERFNSLLGGTRNPTYQELIQISIDYDVSINFLLTGDEMFPSLHHMDERKAKRILSQIEELKPEPQW